MRTGDLIDHYKHFFIVASVGTLVLGPRDWLRRLDSLGMSNWRSLRLARNGAVQSYYQELNVLETAREKG